MDRPGNDDVKAIFITALDREPGSDRAAYLNAVCGDNAELRQRVVALLSAHDRADEVCAELARAGHDVADGVAARCLKDGQSILEGRRARSLKHDVP